MIPERAELKRLAKEDLRNNSPKVYLVTIGLLIITALLGYLSNKIQFPNFTAEGMRRFIESGFSDRMMKQMMGGQTFYGRVLTLAISIFDMMLAIGFISFCLNMIRGMKVGFGNLFDGFNNFFRLLWLNILIGIFTFLWSLLFVIPGIIAAYRYSMAVYIMLDDPSKPAMDCIRESKALTQGWKGKLFALDLSFLGWFILCAIPFVTIYVMPYYRLTHIRYYEALCGDAYAGRQTQQTWNNGWNG